MNAARIASFVSDLKPWDMRAANEADTESLAQLWHAAWHEAHDALVPAALRQARSPEQFAARIAAMLPRVTLVETDDGPLGFCAIQGAEVEHLFVHAKARGRGVARSLMKDGLEKIATGGARQAHLFCLHGNRKGMRFYDRTGWQRKGLELERVTLPKGRVTLRSLRYEMPL
ncbi:MAG: GNAT family N-acetyltransferase [Pseudomonadota bacterium]